MKALLIFVAIEYLVLYILYVLDLIEDKKKLRKDIEDIRKNLEKLDEKGRANQEHWDSFWEVVEKGGK